MAALAEAEPVLCRARPCMAPPPGFWPAEAAGLDVFVLDAPHLFDRPGNPYVGRSRDGTGRTMPQRFAALARIAADIGLGAVPGWVPQAVHCHDWQTGLTPAYLALAGGVPGRER